MTHDEWWHEIGSGMSPLPGEDAHEHAQRVTAACWPAARAAIYEAEAAQLTAPLRAQIERLTLTEEGAHEAYATLVEQKRALQAEVVKLRRSLDVALELIRERAALLRHVRVEGTVIRGGHDEH